MLDKKAANNLAKNWLILKFKMDFDMLWYDMIWYDIIWYDFVFDIGLKFYMCLFLHTC